MLVKTNDSSPDQAKENLRFVAFDFETANYQPDSACSLGIVRVENAKIVHKQACLIKPPYAQDKWCFGHIHSLTYDDVADAPDFKEIWNEIYPLFQKVDFIVAHNVGFDRRVLQALSNHYALNIPEFPYRCSMKTAKKGLAMTHSNLPSVCEKLQIKLRHHNCLSDARACAKIILHASREGFPIE